MVSDPLTVNVFLQNHIEYLSTLFDIHIIANLNQGKIIKHHNLKSVKHLALDRKISPIRDLVVLIKLWIYIYKSNFDAIHTITPKAGLLGMLASKLARTKHRTHIFTGQVWHTKKGILKRFLKCIDSLLVKLATNILVDGHSQREFLIKEKIIKTTNSRVLGNGSISGVLPSKFYKKEELRNSLREKYLIKDTDTVFAFLGRMNKDKGVFDLLEAFSMLQQQYENSKLLMIGPDEESIQNNLQQELKNKVIWIGHTDCPEDFLQMADVFCLPSHREGFGTSVIEASLIGLPVICSDTYGLKDSFVENETGLSHLTGIPNSLLERMKLILMSKELRIQLGKNAREYVLTKFGADEISLEWLKFYENIFQWDFSRVKKQVESEPIKIPSFSYLGNK